MASQQQSGRAASRARRQLQVNGKGRSAAASAPTRQPNRKERNPVPAVNPAPASAPQAAAPVASSFAAPMSMPKPKRAQKSPSRVRRESLAARGKIADRSKDRHRTQDMLRSAKKVVEAKKGDCGCGGPCCKEAEAKAAAATAPAMSAPASNGIKAMKRKPIVNASDTGRMLSRARRSAMSGRGKAGLEAHSKGNSSASLARQANPEITARDLARVVRDSRSKNGARGCTSAAPARARRPRNAAEALAISGTKVGHTEKLTGDEAGLCHTGVTGTSYMSSEVFDQFCKTDAPKAPKKVEVTKTFAGSRVTSGGKVGSSAVMTGNEAGSCRNVTGSEYLGSEHFAQMCDTSPKASPAKVSFSQTQRGQVVSGPRSNRAENVTGNMKGTCKAVTGTPYAGQEEFVSYCTTEDQRKNAMRTVMPKRAPGAGKDISGLQPGVSGNKMTGAESGACQAVSGTPYVAASEMGKVCATSPALQGEADFPQPAAALAEGAFSVLPSVASSDSISASSVTGSGYEGTNSITGTFAMGKGKVTGTEESRFGTRSANVVVIEPKAESAPVSRVTGEGIETGLRITGDDWDRGDRVTGTEGSSAARRNPSRRGPMSAMPQVDAKREPQIERASANVTGGSGGSQGSAAITVSGGARG